MSLEQLEALLGEAARGGTSDFAWLDGGPHSCGWAGVRADRVIESNDLSDLGALDRAWKAEPQKVWIGWIDYDLGVDALLNRPASPGARPGFCARRYPQALKLDSVPARRSGAHQPAAPWPIGKLQPELDAAQYRDRVERAIEYIRKGDSYQINLSQAFRAQRRGDESTHAQAVALYSRLREQTPSSMGALIQSGSDRWLVSNSPETLFELRVRSGGGLEDEVSICSWPIKGTRPRHASADADAAAAADLMASEKDLAEHIMIVDLVRSDLGRVSQVGSVQVDGPPALTSFPTVHHLVSEVRASLAPGWGLAELVGALFPGGSITGAPKRRTCEIIDTLEGEARGIYCGAIFVLHPHGAHFSIPIRTGELSAEGFSIRSGGGIVVDSDPEDERLETLAKARAFDPERLLGRSPQA